ncbi:pyruvate dehydrogenase E2 component (dihydrolipoamide acetyltransferase) [Rhodobium orientis]|uniref:Acetoin dehydrogenase dihydrolipoyllysine-residue acetyltransferase subunit n=1 Tax=Rhodobium orientis TaxID=34017 RepID=A0A327JS13_9HYPH|nr:acetoin dehydrogenase dihydrolipoyllysine-residue acetyltransferase subunit [Rhodobium orientis]MBB4302925.1 pyruvate dehydrogenase E2 component (dihydrolipoamide acetyltransferase) [Rhodobium orientis]MBK5949486.1 acetoin dehydrogenase dihydrolipoyllysine-residue acetyltransferase subunit [Rhodobium orientis]RAI29279.1 acetoin dehydrogenase dihydrolipoyllysine-residue acetyltransferase subunit [Rhodobium orientis]
MTHPITLESAGGEYMESVVVVEWTKKPGEAVAEGEVVVVVETAKAASEIPAPHSGYLQEILFQPGEEADIGSVLGRIGDEPSASASAPAESAAPAPKAADDTPAPAAPSAAKGGARVVATPLARRVARERGIDLHDLRGTGPRGRIKLRDVEAAKAAPKPAAAAPQESAGPIRDAVPVVFLHGFGADKTAWSRVVPLIDRAVTPILIDLPGHGASDVGAIARFDDVVEAVAAELDDKGITAAHLVGHSLGGGVALALCGLGRIAVHSLCLIAPAGLGPEINGGFLDGMANARSAETLEPWLDAMTGDDFALQSGYARTVLRQWQARDTQKTLAEMAEGLFPGNTQSMRLVSVLADLAIPAKVLWGLDDRIIPSAHAFSASAGVGLHLMKGAGHVPHMEQPALTARLINELARAG